MIISFTGTTATSIPVLLILLLLLLLFLLFKFVGIFKRGSCELTNYQFICHNHHAAVSAAAACTQVSHVAN